MEKLSLKSYGWKCVLGAEVVYVVCLKKEVIGAFEYLSKIYYFCSKTCLDHFRTTPERYAEG